VRNGTTKLFVAAGSAWIGASPVDNFCALK